MWSKVCGQGIETRGLFSVKVVQWDGSKLLSVCDEELLGATLRDHGLEVHLSSDYFSGRLVDAEEALQLVKLCDISNLVGQRIVEMVLSQGLANPGAVKEIQRVPFLMIFRFSTR